MADSRPELRALFTAEAIERIAFRTALRGYDTQQVRDYLRAVAGHLRTMSGQIDDLTARLREAERRADHPVLDEATLASALGEETARILRSAHEAAADIRGRAEEHVERVVQQAREEGTRLNSEAAKILDVRRSAAETEAAEILRAANEEAQRVTAEAAAKATAMMAEAEESARTIVEQAKAERNEVLSDVRHRRRVANTQIEQLRAGRERLMQAYEVVRSTLETVTNELDVADVEAKAAAEEVGRRMNAAIDPLRADALASTPLVDVPESAPVPGPAANAPSRPHRKKGKGARPPVVPTAQEPVPEPAPLPPRDEDPPSESQVAEVAVEPEPEPEPVAETQPEEPEPQPEPEPVAASATDDVAAARVASRAETCEALEEHLSRRLKRALQDEQNLVLDRLRSVRGALNADAALGAESEHLASYARIVEPALADAARAGAAATGNVIDVPGALVGIVANDLAIELVLPLRRQLDERLHEAAAVGDDHITASDRVSSAYREAKSQRATRLASEWLVAAWAVGVDAATPTGTPGVWASDPAKPCCTDCDDNGLAGAVPAGTPYPTGHLHPPAHPGCRCVVVPTA